MYTMTTFRKLIATTSAVLWVAVMSPTTLAESDASGTLSNPVLKQIHVITRHGEDTRLHTETSSEAFANILTPLGRKQMYDLGTWLRETYYHKAHHHHHHGGTNATTNQQHNPFEQYKATLEKYSPLLHTFEASGIERTLSSAEALGKGLFPNSTYDGLQGDEVPSVPVYSTSENNDVVLRADQNCPIFEDSLLYLFRSKSWKNLEIFHKPLLTKLGEHFPRLATYNHGANADGKIAMKDIGPIYDRIHVARTHLGNANFEWLDDSEFQELAELMQMTEQMRYGALSGGNLLGSNLWSQIISRFDDGPLFVYSARGPTILGLLGTILEELAEDEASVEYGSALIVEVYHDDANDVYLRFLYKSGESDSARQLDLEHIECNRSEMNADGTATGTAYCKSRDFMSWLETNAIPSQEDWCKACDNTASDVCMKALLEEKSNEDSSVHFTAGNSIVEHTKKECLGKKAAADESVIKIGSFFFGLVVGLLLITSFNFVSTILRQRTGNDDGNANTEKGTVVFEESASNEFGSGEFTGEAEDATNRMHDDEVYEEGLAFDQELPDPLCELPLGSSKKLCPPPQSVWEHVRDGSKVV